MYTPEPAGAARSNGPVAAFDGHVRRCYAEQAVKAAQDAALAGLPRGTTPSGYDKDALPIALDAGTGGPGTRLALSPGSVL